MAQGGWLSRKPRARDHEPIAIGTVISQQTLRAPRGRNSDFCAQQVTISIGRYYRGVGSAGNIGNVRTWLLKSKISRHRAKIDNICIHVDTAEFKKNYKTLPPTGPLVVRTSRLPMACPVCWYISRRRLQQGQWPRVEFEIFRASYLFGHVCTCYH